MGSWKRIIAFEWLMFVLLGAFWAAAMFVPLFITQAIGDRTQFLKNMIILWGPYGLYLVVRFFYLIFVSCRRAYLVATLLFSSRQEKRMAQEWLIMLVLVVLWSGIMAYPLYITECFSVDHWPVALLVLAGPYMFYGLGRVLLLFFRSIGWAVRTTTAK